MTPIIDAGPYTCVWTDALTLKIEGEYILSVACLLPVGDDDGSHEILGLGVVTTLGRLPAFFRSLIARSPRAPAIADNHTGAPGASAATLEETRVSERQLGQ